MFNTWSRPSFPLLTHIMFRLIYVLLLFIQFLVRYLQNLSSHLHSLWCWIDRELRIIQVRLVLGKYNWTPSCSCPNHIEPNLSAPIIHSLIFDLIYIYLYIAYTTAQVRNEHISWTSRNWYQQNVCFLRSREVKVTITSV